MSLSSHPWHSPIAKGFRSRPYQRVLGLDWHLMRLAVFDRQSLFVIGGWGEPVIIVLIILLSMMRHSFVIWTDTPQANPRRHPLKAYLRAAWLRWVFGRVTRVMGTGTPALQVLQRMGVPESKLVNFPCFIDLDCFRPQPREDTQELVFVSSGRLIYKKGYDLALAALATVFGSRAQSFRYLIAGTGPEQKHLLHQASELGIIQFIELVGWLEPQDLPIFFASANIFLHPARIEPYGVAVLEAMASGLIVIGSDATGAVLDRIQSGVNGFIYRSEDIQDLATQIQHVLDQSENWSTIGRAARTTAEEWPVSRAVETVRAIMMERK